MASYHERNLILDCRVPRGETDALSIVRRDLCALTDTSTTATKNKGQYVALGLVDGMQSLFAHFGVPREVIRWSLDGFCAVSQVVDSFTLVANLHPDINNGGEIIRLQVSQPKLVRLRRLRLGECASSIGTRLDGMHFPSLVEIEIDPTLLSTPPGETPTDRALRRRSDNNLSENDSLEMRRDLQDYYRVKFGLHIPKSSGTCRVLSVKHPKLELPFVPASTVFARMVPILTSSDECQSILGRFASSMGKHWKRVNTETSQLLSVGTSILTGSKGFHLVRSHDSYLPSVQNSGTADKKAVITNHIKQPVISTGKRIPEKPKLITPALDCGKAVPATENISYRDAGLIGVKTSASQVKSQMLHHSETDMPSETSESKRSKGENGLVRKINPESVCCKTEIAISQDTSDLNLISGYDDQVKGSESIMPPPIPVGDVIVAGSIVTHREGSVENTKRSKVNEKPNLARPKPAPKEKEPKKATKRAVKGNHYGNDLSMKAVSSVATSDKRSSLNTFCSPLQELRTDDLDNPSVIRRATDADTKGSSEQIGSRQVSTKGLSAAQAKKRMTSKSDPNIPPVDNPSPRHQIRDLLFEDSLFDYKICNVQPSIPTGVDSQQSKVGIQGRKRQKSQGTQPRAIPKRGQGEKHIPLLDGEATVKTHQGVREEENLDIFGEDL